MIRKLVLALVLAAVVLQSAALAAKPKHATVYKAGQACTMAKQATYKAHHLKCVKGYLRAIKK